MMDHCGFIMVHGRELRVYRRILIGRAALGEQSEMARCPNRSAGLAVTGSEYDTGEQVLHAAWFAQPVCAHAQIH